jgi:hypothetical protein
MAQGVHAVSVWVMCRLTTSWTLGGKRSTVSMVSAKATKVINDIFRVL